MSASPVFRRSASRAAMHGRRGKIIVMTAFLMTTMMAMIAFSVDVGYMAVTRTEIQICTDAAALAGAAGLVDGSAAAVTQATSYLGKNKVGGQTLTASNATIVTGMWNDTTKVFTAGGDTPNAIKINTSLSNTPLFFGKALNKQSFNTSAQSIATYQPRDIALVLDYSGSMAYDSQFRNMSLIGKSAIEANLLQIWQELGSPTYGTLPFTPLAYGDRNTSKSSVKSKFKLTNVAYPYPDGSWDEYIDYVQDNSYINSAGYRCKYGLMTWVHFQMEKFGSAADSPGFHVTSQQPLTALKDAVDEFLGFLSENSTDDRVAFSLYTASDNTAKLEQALTKTYTLVSDKVQGRQAGHYVGSTNISAGMTKGRLELQNNSRVGVSKLLVLMTDGEANLPTGNTSTDKQKVRDEAALCAAAKIPVVTITVGAGADVDLMQEVADITGGAAFVVPGGQPISQVQEQLEQVFSQVAADRPLKLVQ
ncbi:von Willebrand factor type A domain protein [Anatilimnocola aggregata]|uniref:von Willebrand factor type A domain protein n=1 Tax=Anatilimnocola aggregata TaxID=2528021 RepID=A0A517YLD7_9BACT|nr:VWA domain-containing protein [Anatilimnocola aggregata]QDU31042.1 von Willebrand factor type A domain protein [Anatilimnocola aggregata]